MFTFSLNSPKCVLFELIQLFIYESSLIDFSWQWFFLCCITFDCMCKLEKNEQFACMNWAARWDEHSCVIVSRLAI